ncbi:M15 family metallopeptidase [Psychromonas sp. KJ10-10]|uniref:M15 family metallopeptidase n=1 Tax=Psychromonas sp. KJ10-10 TaxID=3391823 RepID=UPI0039B6058B
MQIEELTGQVETHLAHFNSRVAIHQKVIEPFLALQNEAQKSGFNLQIASGFRSFERQRLIWNNKFSGKAPILAKDESQLSAEALSDYDKLLAILHWSALPGASRHHWGTDFDIYDPSLLPQGKSLQLICSEYQKAGYFYELSQWMNENMQAFNFYRPYQKYQGGVAIEPWHISYHPIAKNCLNALTETIIHDLIINNNVFGKSLICEQLPMIYKQYICNINDSKD